MEDGEVAADQSTKAAFVARHSKRSIERLAV